MDNENKEVVVLNQNIIDSQTLIMQAITQGANVDILERLLAMRERIHEEEAKIAFREAMSRFQAECPIIPKKKKVLNKDGKTVRYKYAPIEDIIKAVQPILEKNGLSYDIETETISDGIVVTVKAFHALGHSKATKFTAPIDPEAYMNEPQKWASAQTFAKRYAFCNAFGILTGDEDNDTNQPLTPEQKAKEAEQEAHKAAAMEQMNALPDDIKDGFRILKYNSKMVYLFCEKFAWENNKIKMEINKIIDMKEGTKK